MKKSLIINTTTRTPEEMIGLLSTFSNLLINVVIGSVYELVNREVSVHDISNITGLDVELVRLLKNKKCEDFAAIIFDVATSLDRDKVLLH